MSRSPLVDTVSDLPKQCQESAKLSYDDIAFLVRPGKRVKSPSPYISTNINKLRVISKPRISISSIHYSATETREHGEEEGTQT
jgi:hypothetical protein